jgi:hypothetical protein
MQTTEDTEDTEEKQGRESDSARVSGRSPPFLRSSFPPWWRVALVSSVSPVSPVVNGCGPAFHRYKEIDAF